MRQFTIRITSLTPLMLSAGPPAHNLLETLDCIPGNSIRGLLATRFLEKSGSSPSDPLFKTLFLDKMTRFSFATLDGTLPVPASARTCKYDTGFTGQGGHGVLDWVLQNDEGIRRCPVCEGPLDYFDGYWSPLETKRKTTKKKIIVRTAIDPKRNSASSGRLYSSKVIEEGQTFLAHIEVDEDQAAQAISALLKEPFTGAVGKGKSRGQGWVQVEKVEDGNARLNWELANERYKQFKNKGMQALVVTLLSDGIFTDDYLRDLSAPSIFNLEPLGIDPEEWETEPYSGFSSVRTIFGFDGPPLFLPRIPRVAVKAGSVFLFRPKKEATANANVPSGNGMGWIGENNQEGYGRAILWHPFHISPEGWKWTQT